MGLYQDVFPCTYIFIKESLTSQILGKRLKNIIALCLTIFLLVILSILLGIYFIINSFMRLFLFFWHWKNYGGVLGMDSYFEHSKIRINYVYIVEHSGTFEELLEMLKQSCSRLQASHFKFSSTIHSICGFYYLLKNKVSLNDVLSVEENFEVSSKAQLLDYLERYYFNDWNDNVLWKVIAFKNPIAWRKDDKIYYPIIIKCNHCIGDGIELSIFAQQFLLNDVGAECFEKILKKSPKSRDVFNTTNIGSVLLMGPKIEYSNINLSDNDSQHLAIFIEEEPKYIDLIKSICKRLNCSFTDVITTAALSSIIQYLKLNDVKPTNLIVYNTTRPLGDNLELVQEGKYLKNEFTLETFNLPWGNEGSMLVKFNEIKEILRDGRNSATGQIIYLLSNILSYIHPSLIGHFARYNSIGTTLGISNIPFADSAKMGKCPVKDNFVFVNHFEYTKFTLVILSFEGRLQVSLTTKKYLKTSREELQLILDNIFVNIDTFYEEVKLL